MFGRKTGPCKQKLSRGAVALVACCVFPGVTGIIPPVHAHAHAHTHTHTHTHTQAWLDGVTALQPAFLQPPVWVHDSSGGGGGGGGSEHKRAARANSACVDYTVESYFSGKTKIAGIPSGSYVARPAAISPCELEQLHTDCINRINMYRSGALKFTDGTSDPDVVSGRSPLLEATGANQCSSEASLGDLKINVEGGGGCAGGHAHVRNLCHAT